MLKEKHQQEEGSQGNHRFPAMIRIKENIKPNITKINFACDNEIHKKLNKYELTKEFLNKSNTTLMIGRQGSGKTSLLINLA